MAGHRVAPANTASIRSPSACGDRSAELGGIFYRRALMPTSALIALSSRVTTSVHRAVSSAGKLQQRIERHLAPAGSTKRSASRRRGVRFQGLVNTRERIGVSGRVARSPSPSMADRSAQYADRPAIRRRNGRLWRCSPRRKGLLGRWRAIGRRQAMLLSVLAAALRFAGALRSFCFPCRTEVSKPIKPRIPPLTSRRNQALP